MILALFAEVDNYCQNLEVFRKEVLMLRVVIVTETAIPKRQ